MKPSDDIKRKVINGQSVIEMMKETGLSETTIRRCCKQMVAQGTWEEGYRKVPYGFVKVFKKIK